MMKLDLYSLLLAFNVVMAIIYLSHRVTDDGTTTSTTSSKTIEEPSQSTTSSSDLKVSRISPKPFVSGQLQAPLANNTITVYLTKAKDNGRDNPSLSIFKTDLLQRYGTGRYHILIRDNAYCSTQQPTLCKQNVDGKFRFSDVHHAPCLVVTRSRDGCSAENLKCEYPQCKTMLANDERCKPKKISQYDMRQYYTADQPKDVGYLPLGPRLDAWESFQKLQQWRHFFIIPASKRQYVFNAIFSESTNAGRQHLANILKKEEGSNNLPIYTTIAEVRRG